MQSCLPEYLKLLRYRTWAPWNPPCLQKSRCPKDLNPETLPAHQWNQTRADNHGLSFPNTLRWVSSQTWAKAAYLFIHIMKQTSWEKSGRRHKKVLLFEIDNFHMTIQCNDSKEISQNCGWLAILSHGETRICRFQVQFKGASWRADSFTRLSVWLMSWALQGWVF